MDKICLFCKHFRFEPAGQSYSEWTPGYDARVFCAKGYWELDIFNDHEEEFRAHQLKANTCPDFETEIVNA